MIAFVIGATFWPRGVTASAQDLIDDLNNGAVVAVELGRESTFGGIIRPASNDPIRVRWKTESGGTWHTFRTEDVSSYGVTRPTPEEAANETILFEGTDRITNVLTGQLARHPDVPVTLRGMSGASLANVLLLFIGVWIVAELVWGKQPRIATKWGWFWFLFIPGGIGMAWYLLFETQWSTKIRRKPRPLPPTTQTTTADSRINGMFAFIVAVVLGVVITHFVVL
ncbi:hypothetical protein GCM10011410_04080 [Hoyosella rhizosphaerae]|uniref:Uncharacterized protein n=1 Tax=Hoyosella rhizosphaerae TaxID=1755582 RepID=A0A916XA05_9ACTN|nr:hypothetical protein GCM10011410_04080 [Hoyosella rhizosphaerae]